MRHSVLIGIAFSAVWALGGCGGSGGAAFSPTSTVQAPTSNVGPALHYSAPVEVSGGFGATIVNVSPNGQMIGQSSNGTSMYWASPTATPAIVNTGGYPTAVITGINNAGQMVGGLSNGPQFLPAYWSSPSAAPTFLTTQTTNAVAITINASGQIVGYVNPGNNSTAAYWSSPTATAIPLAGIGGQPSPGSQALRISDGGLIYGYLFGEELMWTTTSSNAVVLALPTNGAPAGNSLLGYGFDQETGEIGGSYRALGGNDLAFQWSLPGYTFGLLPVPSGYTEASSLMNIGPNHFGVGYFVPGGQTHACIWPTLSKACVDLTTLIPSGTNWTLEYASFVTDSGIIIGPGLSPTDQSTYYTVHPS